MGGGDLAFTADTKDGARHAVNIDDFTIIKVIGRGSFGKVYMVRKNDSGSYYAMKVLKKEMVLKRNQKSNTKAERHILEALDHPFLVKLYYAF